MLINGCFPSLSDIRFSCNRGASLPWEKRDDWQQNAWDYRVTLRFGRRQMSLDFFTGKGWAKEPGIDDVLSCLFSDARCEGIDFDEFCSEYGYDADSYKAHATWKAVTKQAARIREFLGEDFDALLTEWEEKENQ